MKRAYKVFLFLILFYKTTTDSYGQEIISFARMDTITNEITTFISLVNIPDGGRVRFQQRLHPKATLTNLPSEFLLWDTANNILTLISSNYPSIDTLAFKFVCKTDSLPDVILWGESALMYENKKGIVQKITSPARNYIVRQNRPDIDTLQKESYYIQISASNTMQKKNDIAKLVHLQNEHIILEQKTEKYYKYFIGNFTSKEQASTYLKYYRQYIPDAFIIQF